MFLQPASSHAQEETDTLEEIIVSAQKREQSLQEVPITISAFDAEFLGDHGISDMQDLYLYTPGYVGQPTYDFIGLSTIRGIRSNDFGYGGDPAFGVFVDGFYQGRTGASISSLYDVQRVEVVKGPQATLFGRTATSGAISVTNNQPTDVFEGNVQIGLGERDRQELIGTINVPLGEFFSVRGSYLNKSIDGYLVNQMGGPNHKFRDIEAARLALRLNLDRIDATLTYNQEDRKGSGNDRHQGFTADYISDLIGTESHIFTEIDDISLKVGVELTDSMNLELLSAYRDTWWDYAEDFDSLGIVLNAPFLQGQTSKLTSHELRLSNTHDSGTSWFVGVNVFDDDVTGFIDERVDQGFAFSGLLANVSDEPFYELGEYASSSKGWSVYGEVSFDFTDVMNLTLGGRYSYDEKEMQVRLPNPATDPRNTPASFPCACYLYGLWTSEPVSSSGDWNDTSFRAALTYEINESVRAFFTFSQGFKPGGIDSFGFDTDDPNFQRFFGFDGVPAGVRPKVYGPEQIDNFEVGLKTQLLDDKLRLNVAAFIYDYDGLQVAVNTSGAAFGIENVGTVRGDGLEFDILFVASDHWEFAANAGITNTEVTKLAPGVTRVSLGDRLVYNPKLTGSAFATFRHPIGSISDAYIRGEYSYSDEMYGTNGLLLPSYSILGLRAGLGTDRWSVSAFVRNLSDETYFTNGTGERFFTNVNDLVGGLGEPRTAGLDIQFRF